MKKALLASLFVCGSALAQEYQSISRFNYATFDGDSKGYITSTYYFDKRKVLGGLDQFKYVNTTNNVWGSYIDGAGPNVYRGGGEYFAENFTLGGSLSYQENDFGTDTTYFMNAGYVFNEDLIARVNYRDNSDIDGAFSYDVEYEMDLNSTDYLGFWAWADEEFDNYGAGTKYYGDFGDENYFIAYLNLYGGDNDYWSTKLDYYFSNRTKMWTTYNKSDDVSLGVMHYLNPTWAVAFAYGSNTDESYDEFSLTINAQF